MTQDKTCAPKTIWLQVGDEPCSYSEAMICGDVSWCADKIFEHDIEYKLVEPQTTSQYSAWTFDDIDFINCNSNTLEQFCLDNIRLAPFFAMLANEISQHTSQDTERVRFTEAQILESQQQRKTSHGYDAMKESK